MMLKAPHTTDVTVVNSPNISGVCYEMRTTVVPDACMNCKATGVVRFYTEADIMANQEWECDCDEECDCEPLDQMTGERPCERCDGTGVCAGDGPLSIIKINYPHDLFKASIT